MTGSLEHRYRRLLTLLPAAYRAEWEEEMVATLLAGVAARSDDPDELERADYQAEFGWPSWSEAASVVGLAVTLRLPWRTGAAHRQRMWGDAARLVALLGLLVHGAMGTVGVGMHLWIAGALPWPPPGDWVAMPSRWPVFLSLLDFVYAPAYVALVLGRVRIARWLASVGVCVPAVSALADVIAGYPFPVATCFAVLVGLLPVLATWAFDDGPVRIDRRRWLAVLPLAVTAGALGLVGQNPASTAARLMDWAGTCCVVLAAGTAGYLTRHLVRRTRPPAATALALTVLAAAVVAQRLATLAEFTWSAPAAEQRAILVIGVVQTALVIAVAWPLAMRAGRALRRQPDTVAEGV